MRDLAIERILASRGIKFKYEAEIPVTSLERDASYQVRHLPGGKAKKADVRRLAELLKAGADVGPLVLIKGPDDTYLIVEGNTRTESLTVTKRPFTAAYVVEIESARAARTLSLELNQRWGTKMTKAEVEDYFRSLNGSMPSVDEFIKITGYTKTSLERMIGAGNFDNRCVKAGLDPRAKPLAQGTRVWIAQVQLASVFKAFAELGFDARLDEGMAKQLVSKIKAEDNEGAQLGIIAQARASMQDRIDDLKFGYSNTPAGAGRQISMHCGWIRNAAADGTINDLSPDSRHRSRVHLEEALESLQYALTTFYAS